MLEFLQIQIIVYICKKIKPCYIDNISGKAALYFSLATSVFCLLISFRAQFSILNF